MNPICFFPSLITEEKRKNEKKKKNQLPVMQGARSMTKEDHIHETESNTQTPN